MIVIQIALALIGLMLLLRALNLVLALRWYSAPKPPGDIITVDGRRTYYRLAGQGDPTVVIESALGTPSVEWWGIQDELAKVTRVLTYDRAGYCWSDVTAKARSSGNIALELNALLNALGIDGPLVLLGHSLGGLYVNHFSRLFPGRVAGVVMLDPLSPNDIRFLRELPSSTYKRTGVDKTRGMKAYYALCSIGILRLLKPLVLKGPPFLYYRDLASDRINAVWQHLQLPKLYKTVMREYALARREGLPELLAASGAFPPVQLRVLYHSRETVINEIIQHGGLRREDAERVEELWEGLVREHLELSPLSEWIASDSSGHQIHLQSPDLVVRSVVDMVQVHRRKSSSFR